MPRDLNKPAGGKQPALGNPRLDWRDLCIYACLILAIIGVYSQVRSYSFVNLDDPEYVQANPHVRGGLTWDNVRWTLLADRDGNWFPLTWLSHMLDCQIYGMQSGGHHLTNVVIHLLTTLLLFALLKKMTGARWCSAVVAFLFALHPLHVESVAWVTERKDVLSGFFWVATFWGYLSYVERPRWSRYLVIIVPFCLGLMSKPMIVTLPLVLLLLDVWPLRRITIGVNVPAAKLKQKTRVGNSTQHIFSRLVWEKVPLLALSAASSVVTYTVQQRGGAVMSLQGIPLASRMANAVVAYVAYLAQLFWPVKLAVFYPHPINVPAEEVIGAGLLLLAISALILRSARKLPYLAVGWAWYLGTLVPVIGLVQVGMQARADRYTYIPAIGIFIMAAWGVAELCDRRILARPVLVGLAAIACSGCLLLTWFQVRNWRNSESLFQHAIEVTKDNYMGYFGMGGVFRDSGRLDDAIAAYSEAIRLFPGVTAARGGLGAVYLKQGRLDEAAAQLSEAVRLNPNSAEDHISLGIAYKQLGRAGDALAQFSEAIKLEPDSADAHYNLGTLYAGGGQCDEAQAQFALALRLEPDHAQTHYNLGLCLASQGKMSEAAAEFTKAIQLKPGYGNAHNNLGSALASMGKIDEAVAHFREAVRLMPESEEARRNLEYALSLQNKPIKK